MPHLKLIQGRSHGESPLREQSPPMLEILQHFASETPPNLRLTRLSFQRLSEFEKKLNPVNGFQYRIYVFGEVLQQKQDRIELVLQRFIERMVQLGYFKSITILKNDTHPISNRLEFKFVAMV